MLAFWKIAGLENCLWLMPTANQNYPHSFFIKSSNLNEDEFQIYKVSYTEESNDYKVEYLNLSKYRGKLSLGEYTSEIDPLYHKENSNPILCEKFDRIKALVKPLFDLLYEDDYIGSIDESYLNVGHCFYYNDEYGWYFCRVRYIGENHFDCDRIEVKPKSGIKAASTFLSTYYDFFEEYRPKYVDPEFFDYVWNLFITTRERALEILLGREA